MATTNEIIYKVDTVKHNTFTSDEKKRWILELDGKIFREIMGDMGELPWQEQQNELDVQLLAEAPYDDIYVYYLLAMIDFYNREPENYNNSYMMFNEKYNDFAKWWQRTHTPQKSGGFNTMGFGA